MPNIKSAKKRVIVNDKKAELNKSIRSALRTAIKKVDAFVAEGKYEEAKAALSLAFKALDSAAVKNIIHDNNAANKKAKLSKRVSAIAPKTEEVKEEKAEAVEEKPAKKTTTRKTTKKAEETAE